MASSLKMIYIGPNESLQCKLIARLIVINLCVYLPAFSDNRQRRIDIEHANEIVSRWNYIILFSIRSIDWRGFLIGRNPIHCPPDTISCTSFRCNFQFNRHIHGNSIKYRSFLLPSDCKIATCSLNEWAIICIERWLISGGQSLMNDCRRRGPIATAFHANNL